jgi:hypothetical protein
LAGAIDAQRDLAAIGNENLGENGVLPLSAIRDRFRRAPIRIRQARRRFV